MFMTHDLKFLGQRRRQYQVWPLRHRQKREDLSDMQVRIYVPGTLVRGMGIYNGLLRIV